MSNHAAEIDFPKINQQRVELLTNETLKMDIPHTQDSVSNPPRTEEPSKITSSPQMNVKDQETQTELHTNEKLVHTIASSLHDIFTRLTKVTKLQLSNPSDTRYNKLSQQLQTLSKQVERLQQSILRDANLRKLQTKKQETRTCFR